MNIKVLITTGIYPPEIGGPATYSKILNRELPKHGFVVSVLPFSAVRRLPKVIRHVAYFFKVLIQGRKADIIFAQDPVSVGFPALCAAKVIRKRFFLRVGGDYAWEQAVQRAGVNDTLDVFSQNRSYSLSVRLLKWAQSFVAQHAEVVITPSEYLKRIVQNWGIPEQKITVIYNAFTPIVRAVSRMEAREKLDLHGTIIISAGRLVPWKGFEALIDLVPSLLKDVPDLAVLIAGDGPQINALKRKIEDVKMEHRVRLLGRVESDDLKDYIRASDIFVLNTAYEGLSHQLLEVMALKIPIVTTHAGGNPEIIRSGESGLLVPYNDKDALAAAILRLLRDETLRDQCVQNALKTVREFSTERMMKKTAKLFV